MLRVQVTFVQKGQGRGAFIDLKQWVQFRPWKKCSSGNFCSRTKTIICVLGENINESRVHARIRETNILHHHLNQKTSLLITMYSGSMWDTIAFSTQSTSPTTMSRLAMANLGVFRSCHWYSQTVLWRLKRPLHHDYCPHHGSDRCHCCLLQLWSSY